MSHANGMVQFPDKTVMHFEYNGTADVTSYCLDVDGHGEISWYHENSLSLVNTRVDQTSIEHRKDKE